ncbi:N-glycosylase/DNA lyase [Cephus cinctus]|uniref:N-glycosylase/DNA lyase n=1 Tax=Cephus cinctus TaxID=211228 RepID=A0AAJ7C573_CEPCN|nr:N-glycosylase/DNA lyase [Cephus cinctus]
MLRIFYKFAIVPKILFNIRSVCMKMTKNTEQIRTGKIACTNKELGLAITLNGGQSFRWLAHKGGEEFRGVFAGHVWTLSQDENYITYTVHGPVKEDINYETILWEYFRLEFSLEENLIKWSASDKNFKKSCKTVEGVRILKQDPVENIFCFICSSNNNIIRISSMVEKLCRFFGKKLCEVDGKEYYDFPTIESLTNEKVELTLRKENFGYRAAYIANTAKRLMEVGGRKWLMQLCKANNISYTDAREQLLSLPGVGPKVADCVCLMSLGHLEAIPVDTHIFQVAQANYLPHLGKQKTVTPKIHKEVSDHLRQLWGPLAGWAQAVVFCAKINSESRTLTGHKRGNSETNSVKRKSKQK